MTLDEDKAKYYANWRFALEEAKRFAEVPKKSGIKINANEINKTSRGPNFFNMLQTTPHEGDIHAIGMKSPNGKNMYYAHKDGHLHMTDNRHHFFGHIHAQNWKGEEKIFAYGEPLTKDYYKYYSTLPKVEPRYKPKKPQKIELNTNKLESENKVFHDPTQPLEPDPINQYENEPVSTNQKEHEPESKNKNEPNSKNKNKNECEPNSRNTNEREPEFKNRKEHEHNLRNKKEREPKSKNKNECEPNSRNTNEREPEVKNKKEHEHNSRSKKERELESKNKNEYEPNSRNKNEREPEVKNKKELEPKSKNIPKPETKLEPKIEANSKFKKLKALKNVGKGATAVGLLSTVATVAEAEPSDRMRVIARETTKTAFSSAGAYIGGFIGSAIPLAGTLIGALIGGFLGDIAGAETFDHAFGKEQIQGEKMGAGIDGGNIPGKAGGPGGVEFRNIKPIIGIQSSEIILSKELNIFFETQNETDLRNAFNSLCLPNFKNRKISEYFDTIMCEASQGLLSIGELPFISIHFNNEYLLYSVMPFFYKNTLIGNILTFIDYFLKGFLNGGFLPIDFIEKWAKMQQNKSSIDFNVLNANLVDIRKSLNKEAKISGYRTLNDLVDEDFRLESKAAFRIIGKMKSIYKSDEILFSNASFSVEYDIYPSSKMQKLLATKNSQTKSLDEISSKYYKMKEIVKELMPKVPEFRGFFNALEMVTFALYYTSSLHSIGKTAVFKNAFQLKENNCKYVNIIPEIFPPLPVQEKIKIDPNINTIDVIEVIKGSVLDKEINDILLEKKKDFSTTLLVEFNNKIEKMYRSKISVLIEEDSKNFNDDEIRIIEFVSKYLYFIKGIPLLIKKCMTELLSNLMDNIQSLTDADIENETNDKQTFAQVESRCRKILNDLPNIINSVFDKKMQKIIDDENEIRAGEAKLLSIPASNRKQPKFNEAYNQIRSFLNSLQDEKNDLNKRKNECIKVINDYQNNLITFSTASHSFTKVYKEIIDAKHSYSEIFYISRPKFFNNKNRKTITGGCIINVHKQLKIQNLNSSIETLSEIRSCLNSKNQEFVKCSDKTNGFALKMDIVPMYDDGAMLKALLLKSYIGKNNKFINDMSYSHIAASIGDIGYLEKMNKTELQAETLDHKTPAYMACDCGNILSIRELAKKNISFDKKLPNGITPFLLTIMKGHHDAAVYLLSNKNIKIGNIDCATDTGVTPLHWAVYHNFPDVVKLLLERGASVNLTLRSNGMTPIHLACYYNRYECLCLLAASKKAQFDNSAAGIDPLHYALAYSIKCARFLINQGRIDLRLKDIRGFSMKEIAIMNGQYNILQYLPNTDKIDKIKTANFLQEKNESDFIILCYALSSGSLNIAEKTATKILKSSPKVVFNNNQILMLIESACLGRRSEFVELLSELINFENHPISLYASAEGLVDWIEKIQKFGGDLMYEENERTIFDDAVKHSDSKFLKKAFEIISNVPIEVIRRIVKKSIIIKDIEVMETISDSIMPKKRNYHLLAPSDIFFQETSVNAFCIYEKNLDPKIKFQLHEFIDILSFSLSLTIIQTFQFSNKDLINSCIKARNNRRSDTAYGILQLYPSLIDEIIEKNPSSKLKKLKIDNLVNARKMIIELIGDLLKNEEEKVNKCKDIFSDVFDIGDIYLCNKDRLVDAVTKSAYGLWILKALPNRYHKAFYVSEKSFNKSECDEFFRKELDILEQLEDISNAGSALLNSLKKLNFAKLDLKGLADEFACSLIDTMKTKYINATDDDNNTIFHYVSRFITLSNDTMEKIGKLIKNSKNIINAKNNKRENMILILGSSGNMSALKYLIESGIIDIKNDDISQKSFYKNKSKCKKIDMHAETEANAKNKILNDPIKARNIYGENILHKILNSKAISNDSAFSIISMLVHYYPELILQQDRNGEIPFIIAAKRGFNGIIALMSTFYPTSFLNSLTDKSCLHYAAEYNYPETVSYIVQNLHVNSNIKCKIGFSPLHYAAKGNSIKAFKKLIELGANPLIAHDDCKLTAIDYVLRFGSKEMISYIMKTISFNISLCSSDILVNLALNKEAYPLFHKIASLIHPTAIFTCGPDGNNLISIACLINNRHFVSDLLLLGCDPGKLSIDKQNSIHICSNYNSIGCSTIILKHIGDTKGKEGVQEILKVRDLNGDNPYHIAAKKGFDGFIVHLLTSNYEYDPSGVNNSGNTALEEALKGHHTKTAAILTHHWIDLLNVTPEDIKENMNDESLPLFENLLSTKQYQSSEKILQDIKNNIVQYSNAHDVENNKIIEMTSNLNVFTEELEKLGIEISQKTISIFYRILCNIKFQIKFLALAKENKEIANNVISLLKHLRLKSFIKEIIFLMIFPQLSNCQDIEHFIDLIQNIDSYKSEKSDPINTWIENGLITAAETTLSSDSLLMKIKNIVDFVVLVKKNTKLTNIIEYPAIPAPVNEIASYILRIPPHHKAIQLKYANFINTSMLFANQNVLSIDFANRIENKTCILIDYLLKKKFDADILETAIETTFDLYENPNLTDKMRELILNKCKFIISHNDLDRDKKSVLSRSDISTWSICSKNIIRIFGFDYYTNVIEEIPKISLNTANKALSAILTIGNPQIIDIKLIRKRLDLLLQKAKEIEKSLFTESRNLSSIIQAFREGSDDFVPYKYAFDGTPVVKLSDEELDSLMDFGEIVEKQGTFINIVDASIQLGQEFKLNPNIENAAKLVALVRQVIRETFNINPFIVQCLAVGSLLLHRINKAKRKKLKGRIAQIATGEGKSIIIAMLSCCIALTGDTVDVISSSSYLAERDAEKFKPFYEKCNLRCGTISDNYENGFDYHIIYSTNTNFEFALLREGLKGERFIKTTLLHTKSKIKRPRMTVIVDEADNLFIDTALSWAQISINGSSELKWIFKPILDEVSNNNFCTPIEIREKLLKLATIEQADSLKKITDERLMKLINSAKNALTLRNGVDYIVGRNIKDQLEIQIVDVENTGRIFHGCHWSGGLHEFVEVKEGLQIQDQSLIAASISHSSFFGQYNEIFGLTGTLGEDSEREELKKIYKIDSFDIPPNRKCIRKREKTIIVFSNANKNDFIIKEIKSMIAKERPILVIVESIQESTFLSTFLQIKGIEHYVLNDKQKQDESFIISRAGLPGAVTIATNTAGRGTDIKVDNYALSKGGLHTLITFWPANLRVECQALGRSGRQGQPGSCRIIFDSFSYGNNEDIYPSDETLKKIYEKRTNKIQNLSMNRIISYKRDKVIYTILSDYFKYIKKMTGFLKSPKAKTIIKMSYPHTNSLIIKSELEQKWAEFFNDIRYNNIKDLSFDTFLNLWSFDTKFPLLSELFNGQ